MQLNTTQGYLTKWPTFSGWKDILGLDVIVKGTSSFATGSSEAGQVLTETINRDLLSHFQIHAYRSFALSHFKVEKLM